MRRWQRLLGPSRVAVEPPRKQQPSTSLLEAVLGQSQIEPASDWEREAARLRDVLKVTTSLNGVLRGEGGAPGDQTPPEVAIKMFCDAASRMFGAHVIGLFLVLHKSLTLMPACKQLVPGMLSTTQLDADQIERLLPAHTPNSCLHKTAGGYIYAHVLYSDNEVVGLVELQAAVLEPDDVLLLDFLIDPLLPALVEFKQTLTSRRLSFSAPPMQQLLKLVGGVAQQLDVQLLTQQIRIAAKEVLGAEMCTVFTADMKQQMLHATSSEEEGSVRFTVPMTNGIAGYCALTGESLNLLNAYDDARFDPTMDRKTQRRTTSVLCMPFFSKEGRVLGVTQVLNKKNDERFTNEDEEMMRALCSIFSVCFINASVFENLKKVHDERQALFELSRATNSNLELAPLMRTIRTTVCNLLNAERCTVFIIHPSGSDELLFNLSEEEGAALHRQPLGRGAAGHCAITKTKINMPNPYDDERFDKSFDERTGHVTNSLLAIPIMVQRGGSEQPLGVIQVMNKRGSKFGADDEQLLESISSALAISISNALLYKAQMEARKYLQAVLNSVDHFVFSVSPRGFVLQANRRLEKLFPQATELAMQTKHISEWMGEDGAAAKELVRDILHVLHEGNTISRSHVNFGRKEGPLLANYKVTPLYHRFALLAPTSLPSSLSNDFNTSAGSSAAGGGRERRLSQPAIEQMAEPELGVLVLIEDVTDLSSAQAQLVHCRSDMAQMSLLLQQLIKSLPSKDLAKLSVPHDSLKKRIDNLAASTTQLDHDAIVRELQACSSLLEVPQVAEEQYNELLREMVQNLAVSDEITPSLLYSFTCPAHFDAGGNECSLLEWHADFVSLADDDPSLLLLLVRNFHALGLTSAFGISSASLVQFLVQLRARYVNTPFHNWRHAVMVAHKVCLVMFKSSLHLYVSKLDFLALLLAALGHDAGHLGRTNSYEVGSESALAITYNNKSVLENHHCAMLHRVLASCPELLGAMTGRQRAYLRKMIIEVILATDMAVHGQVKDKLCALPPQLPLLRSDAMLPVGKTQDDLRSLRSSLLQSIMHGCDLYSPTLPWRSTRQWVARLGQEFENQVQLEADNGLPVSSFLTHNTFSELCASEAGFSGHVVRPFWEAVASCLPEMQTCLRMIESNCKIWREAAAGDETSHALTEAQEQEQKQILTAWGSLPCSPDGWAEQFICPVDLQPERSRLHRSQSIFDGSTTCLGHELSPTKGDSPQHSRVSPPQWSRLPGAVVIDG